MKAWTTQTKHKQRFFAVNKMLKRSQYPSRDNNSKHKPMWYLSDSSEWLDCKFVIINTSSPLFNILHLQGEKQNKHASTLSPKQHHRKHTCTTWVLNGRALRVSHTKHHLSLQEYPCASFYYPLHATKLANDLAHLVVSKAKLVH